MHLLRYLGELSEIKYSKPTIPYNTHLINGRSIILEAAEVLPLCILFYYYIIMFLLIEILKFLFYFMPWRLCDSRNLHHEIESRSQKFMLWDWVHLKLLFSEKYKYDISYMWNLRKKWHKWTFFYKTEIDLQTRKTNLWLPKKKMGEGIDWEFGINGYALLYVK